VAAYELKLSEREEIGSLLDRLEKEYVSAEGPEFLANARILAFSCLPIDLVRFLDGFRRTEFAATVLVIGFEVDDEAIGPTPPHWNARVGRSPTLRQDLFFVMLGSIFGDVFGWATLQDGRLIHDVLPIRNEEHEQSGHGSLAALEWHTEDGFHSFRCDYLGLMGLRNHHRVSTTISTVDALTLTPEQRRVLAQPRFIIQPDNEHLYQRYRHPTDKRAPDPPVPDEWTNPRPTPVLFGDSERPYLRIDPPFMSAVPGDVEAEAALAVAVGQLDTALQDLVIEAGTVCFIDNYRAVHGRRAFRSRYDGTDRWLKKLLVTRDLRKSRAARARPDARVLVPTVLSDDAAVSTRAWAASVSGGEG